MSMVDETVKITILSLGFEPLKTCRHARIATDSGGARGGPAGALAPPNASYIKLICTHKPGLEAIFREI
jgi:hypothetical protein